MVASLGNASGVSAAVAKPESDYPSVGAANYGVVLLFLAYVLSMLDRNILSLLRHGLWHQHPCRVHRLPVPGRRQAALLARHHAGDLQAGRAILFWYCLSAYRKAMEEAGKWEVD